MNTKQATKRFKIILMISILLLAIITIIWSKTAKEEQVSEIPTIKTINAEQKQVIENIEVAGFVRGENRADVAPMASGKILQIFKKEGMLVKKGEKLAIIEASGADAQTAAAQASVTALKKTLNDTERYYDQLVNQAESMPSGTVTDEAISSAKRGRDLQMQVVRDQIVAAEGNANIAKAGKNNFTVTAPFDGIITAIYGRTGGFANFGAPLLNINTSNGFEIESYVSATNGRKIMTGNSVTFQAVDGLPITGIVTAVSAGADTQNLKTLVRIHLDALKNEAHLGDFLHGQVIIPTNEKMISIPRSAIVSRAGDLIVFTVDENSIAKEQNIKIHSENDGLVSVGEGINENQKIVVEGQQYLINGITTKAYAAN